MSAPIARNVSQLSRRARVDTTPVGAFFFGASAHFVVGEDERRMLAEVAAVGNSATLVTGTVRDGPITRAERRQLERFGAATRALVAIGAGPGISPCHTRGIPNPSGCHA